MFGTIGGSGGTVFRANTNGDNYKVLTNLTSAGLGSASGIIQGSDGYLYLTAGFGSARGPVAGVCRMNTNGSGLAVLHEFTNSPDGQTPIGLVEGQGHILYGTTVLGGTNGFGTLYEIGMDGSGYNILYNFGGNNAYPMGALMAGSFPDIGGALYGATVQTSDKLPFGGVFFSLAVNPPLSISSFLSEGTNQVALISWPVWAEGFVLQSTTNLSSRDWGSLGTGFSMVQKNLDIWGMKATNTGPATYYRLMYSAP